MDSELADRKVVWLDAWMVGKSDTETVVALGNVAAVEMVVEMDA
jgi:hypothetical protein